MSGLTPITSVYSSTARCKRRRGPSFASLSPVPRPPSMALAPLVPPAASARRASRPARRRTTQSVPKDHRNHSQSSRLFRPGQAPSRPPPPPRTYTYRHPPLQSSRERLESSQTFSTLTSGERERDLFTYRICVPVDSRIDMGTSREIYAWLVVKRGQAKIRTPGVRRSSVMIQSNEISLVTARTRARHPLAGARPLTTAHLQRTRSS